MVLFVAVFVVEMCTRQMLDEESVIGDSKETKSAVTIHVKMMCVILGRRRNTVWGTPQCKVFLSIRRTFCQTALASDTFLEKKAAPGFSGVVKIYFWFHTVESDIMLAEAGAAVSDASVGFPNKKSNICILKQVWPLCCEVGRELESHMVTP